MKLIKNTKLTLLTIIFSIFSLGTIVYAVTPLTTMNIDDAIKFTNDPNFTVNHTCSFANTNGNYKTFKTKAKSLPSPIPNDNDLGHWQYCTVCGATQNFELHTYGEEQFSNVQPDDSHFGKNATQAVTRSYTYSSTGPVSITKVWKDAYLCSTINKTGFKMCTKCGYKLNLLKACEPDPDSPYIPWTNLGYNTSHRKTCY